MSSRANKRKDVLDVLGKVKKYQRMINGQNRQNYSGLASADFGSVSSSASGGGGSSTTGISSSSFLKITGGTMIGPFGLAPELVYVTANALDISATGEAYSSYNILIGGGQTINNIYGSSFSGQLLFLQGGVFMTNTIGITGNIETIDGSNYTLVGNDMIVFVFDGIASKWKQITRGREPSGGGVNTTLSNLVSPTAINQDLNLLGNSLVMDVDKDTAIYSVTDDELEFHVGGSIKLKMTNAQILFSNHVTLLSGFADLKLGANNISLYKNTQLIGSSASGITYEVPTGDTHILSVNGDLKFQIGDSATYSGNTLYPSVSSSKALGSPSFRWAGLWCSSIDASGPVVMTDSLNVAGNVFLGDSSSDDINLVGNIDSDIMIAAGYRIRAFTSTEIGYYVKNATSTIGAEGTVQIPTKVSGVTSASQANTDFGTEIGCIGLYTSGNPTLVIKYTSSAWQGIILGSSGNPTLFQF